MSRTGGTRLGMMMARPKTAALAGSVAFSMAPSRTCRCQSSGRMISIRSIDGQIHTSRPPAATAIDPLPAMCIMRPTGESAM